MCIIFDWKKLARADPAEDRCPLRHRYIAAQGWADTVLPTICRWANMPAVSAGVHILIKGGASPPLQKAPPWWWQLVRLPLLPLQCMIQVTDGTTVLSSPPTNGAIGLTEAKLQGWRLPTYSVGLALSNSDHKDCSGSFKRCRNPKPNLPCHDCILANRAFLEDHPNPHV